MKKIISITIIIIMILSVFSVNVSANVSANEAAMLTGGELLKQYVLANNIYSSNTVASGGEITNVEANAKATYLQNYIDNSELVRQSYGGRYIKDGELHILFTESTEPDIINTVNEMFENDVVNEVCEYSLVELTALKEYISNLMSNKKTNDEFSQITRDIVSVGIDERSNRVIVAINACTDEKINLFKGLITKTDAISFVDSTGYEIKADIYAGSRIRIGSYGYSVGFRCKKLNSTGTYVVGFMTAGHGTSVGRSVSIGSTQIGYVMDMEYDNLSNVDAAFVYVTNSNYSPSNTLLAEMGTLVSGVYATTYSSGTSVYMVGATTGYSSGVVTSTSTDFYVEEDNLTIIDSVSATYICDNGDSGGVIFQKISLTNCVTGINSAGGYEGSRYISTFSKIANVINRFNIVLY